MSPTQQQADTTAQLAYLTRESADLGYSSIEDLFLDEPELFDAVAAEYRREHLAGSDSWI